MEAKQNAENERPRHYGVDVSPEGECLAEVTLLEDGTYRLDVVWLRHNDGTVSASDA